mmetsp:Transcript_71511/g.125825  ORF Transcript_71511/g.125825 Transcript_71511/m.125825 type:complete len:227 (-) Transcript_71511:224-904(-)
MLRRAVQFLKKAPARGVTSDKVLPDPFEKGAGFGLRYRSRADQEELRTVAAGVETPMTDPDRELDVLLRKRHSSEPNQLLQKSTIKQDVTWDASPLPDDVHYVTVTATMNNTFIIVNDKYGKVVVPPVSAGQVGFKKGGKRVVGPAALSSAQKAAQLALERRVRNVVLRISGFATGRAAALTGLRQSDLNILEVHDVTPIPHNGPRPKRQRHRKRGVTRKLKQVRY